MSSSDVRLNDLVADSSPYGLEEVLKLQPRVLIAPIENTKERIELIAQEVDEVMPMIVGQSFDDYIGYDSRALVCVLIKSIQEMNQKIAELEAKLK